ncbi:MAG: tRNA glutamyl-Q(34) synthetase GluQRS, partial [Gammaproteobacteria bacterium]
AYAHIPAAVDVDGKKLSKQHNARSVDDTKPASTLFSALNFLGQQPDEGLLQGDVEEIIQWGVKHWSMEKIPEKFTIGI